MNVPSASLPPKTDRLAAGEDHRGDGVALREPCSSSWQVEHMKPLAECCGPMPAVSVVPRPSTTTVPPALRKSGRPVAEWHLAQRYGTT